MSQPVGIIAKIKLPEDNYKKYLKKEAAQLLSQNIAASIMNGTHDYYVFRYLKKTNTLYVFFYFHYGNESFLLHHPLLAMLKNIEPYLSAVSSGYITANIDSVNNTPDDFVYTAIIQQQKFIEHRFTKNELKEYLDDAKKYFFKPAETAFNLAIHSKQIVDKTIVTKVKKIQEADRIQNLKDNLHKATPENPIELFSGYFYNGNQLFTYSMGQVMFFENINIQQLRQTPYGVCDNNGVIVGHTYIATDSTKFKMHHKNDTWYYSSAEAVYNDALVPYPNSDGATFRLLSDCVGEDKNYICFASEQLSRQEIGAYKINDSGYFHKNVLLYTATHIRAGSKQLEGIDAATFEIISKDAQLFVRSHQLDDPSGVHAGCFVMHCRDKEGEFIIHNYNIYTTTVQVERIGSLSEYLQKAKPLLRELVKKRLAGS